MDGTSLLALSVAALSIAGTLSATWVGARLTRRHDFLSWQRDRLLDAAVELFSAANPYEALHENNSPKDLAAWARVLQSEGAIWILDPTLRVQARKLVEAWHSLSETTDPEVRASRPERTESLSMEQLRFVDTVEARLRPVSGSDRRGTGFSLPRLNDE